MEGDLSAALSLHFSRACCMSSRGGGCDHGATKERVSECCSWCLELTGRRQTNNNVHMSDLR
jgi:hypothetical protein